MSGSRHKRMNAVRIRKENQVMPHTHTHTHMTMRAEGPREVMIRRFKGLGRCMLKGFAR